MAEAKQPYLNGAYYGPAVPPAPERRSYRSVGRSTSCCCGLPCCLLSTLVKLIVSIVVLIGIAVLVIWLVLHPNQIKAHVETASLKTFNLSGNGAALQYSDLELGISIRNPNRHIGLYYDYIEAQAFYAGTRIGFETLPPFYQGHKNTTMIYPSFAGGNTAVMNGGDLSSTYRRESAEGFYHVDVKIFTNVRLKIWIFKIHGLKPKISCTVRLPAPTNATSTATTFQSIECDVDY